MNKILSPLSGIAIACSLCITFFSFHAFAGETTFSHQYLSLTLPDGWVIGKVPAGSQKETIGYLQSKNIKGSTITVDCYRGFLHTWASTRIRGLKTIAAAYPAGQESLKKPYKIRTAGGKGKAELWRGYVQVGDMTVSLHSPMATVKTKNCWLVMIGFTPDSTAEALDQDFFKIVKSAR